MKAKDVLMLGALAAIWGGSFLFLRIGAPALGPVVLIEVRVLLASAALLGFALVTRQPVRVAHRWWQYLVLGAANAAVPFTLIAAAELRIDVGLAAILNATTPVFTALVAWAWSRARPTPLKIAGVVLGVAGVGVLVGGGKALHGIWAWLPAAFSLLAALSYGMANVFSERYFRGEKPLDIAIGQQLGATLLLLPISLLFLPQARPDGVVIVSVLMLAVVCTAVAYLLYFALIHSVGALRTSTVTFLVPVFAVIWGALFLGESISLRMALGLLVILSSVALIAGGGKIRTESGQALQTDAGHRPEG